MKVDGRNSGILAPTDRPPEDAGYWAAELWSLACCPSGNRLYKIALVVLSLSSINEAGDLVENKPAAVDTNQVLSSGVQSILLSSPKITSFASEIMASSGVHTEDADTEARQHVPFLQTCWYAYLEIESGVALNRRSCLVAKEVG